MIGRIDIGLMRVFDEELLGGDGEIQMIHFHGHALGKYSNPI